MIGGYNIKKGTKESIFCDSESDVSGLTAFGKEWDLQMGSTCYCIRDGEVYMLESDKETWTKQ